MSTNAKRVVEPALNQQQNRRRRKTTSIATGEAKTTLLASPKAKVAKNASPSTSQAASGPQSDKESEKNTQLQRNVSEMRDDEVEEYIETVDAHVNKLLENVKCGTFGR